MRPFFGIVLELTALALIALLSLVVPAGPVFGLYVLVLELLATYLVHCPAHYLVGAAAGIKFRRISLGRTALARVLPARLAGVAGLFPVATLSADKGSLAAVSRWKAWGMYAAGTAASVGAALAVAAASLRTEPQTYAASAWAVALAYLAFDAVCSPKGGDLMRAKKALGRRQ